MLARFIAFLLFAASAAAAQPLVFGYSEWIPRSDGPASASVLLPATHGDGFLTVSGTTLVKLGNAGETLRRAPLPAFANVPTAVLPLGKDYLVTTYWAPWFVVDAETLAARAVTPMFEGGAAAASNGSTTLALWGNTRFRLLDRDGAVLSPPAATLLVPAPSGGNGAVASDGVRYLVVWNDGATMKAIATDADAGVRSIVDVWLADAPTTNPGRPLLAYGGGKYLVVWNDGQNLLARLITRDGAGTGDAVTLATGVAASSLAWDGRDFLVTYGARVARVDTNGKLAGAPRQIEPIAGFALDSVRVVANASAALLLGHDVCGCYACEEWRIGPVDGPLAPLAGQETTASTKSAVVAVAEQAAVVAYEEQSDVTRVRIAFVPSRGAPLSVPTERPTQTKPGAATDGTAFLVAWIETDDRCRGRVAAAIMDASGRFGPVVALSDSDADVNIAPVAAWNGREYAVVWGRVNGPLLGMRVTHFGQPLDSMPLVLADNAREPSIAWSGDGYLLGYVRNSQFVVRRLGADLRPAGAEAALGSAFYGNVASNGTEGVAFYRYVSDLHMVRIDAAGRPGNTRTILLALNHGRPAVVWHNGEWLVTNVAGGGRIARIATDGAVVEEIELFKPSVALAAVSVAATASRVVAIVETLNAPALVLVRTTDPPRPRPRVTR